MLPIQKARNDFKINPASAFGWVLIASYLYYHRFESIFEDTEFDKMMKYLLDNYEKLEHRYKHLMSKDDLAAGSLYAVSAASYPHAIVRLAEHHLREYIIEQQKAGGIV